MILAISEIASKSPGLAAAKPASMTLPSDANFLFFGHRRTGALFAIAQSGVKNNNLIGLLVTLFHHSFLIFWFLLY
jgi:hypothetical protein